MYGFRARLCDSVNQQANLTNYINVIRVSGDDFSVVRRKNNVEVSTGTVRGCSINALFCPGIRLFHFVEFTQLFPKASPFICSDETIILSHVIMAEGSEVYVKIKEPKNPETFLNTLWPQVVQEKKTLFVCIC